MKKIIKIFFVLLLVGCTQSIEKEKFIRKKFPNGSYEFQYHSDDSLIVGVGFNKHGKLEYVSNFPYEDGSEQRIYYFFKSGVVQSKVRIDTLGKVQGEAYYFYPNSGNLSSSYHYLNGVKMGSAVSYHDSSDHIKSVMLYNDEGELYYRKTFDWQGNHLKTEGRKN